MTKDREKEVLDKIVQEIEKYADPNRVHILDNNAWTEIIDGPPEYRRDYPGTNLVTDFDQEMQQRGAAQGPDGLQAEIKVKEAQQKVERQTSAPVNINPVSYDRGVLGQTVLCKFVSGQDGPVEQLVYWPGDTREAMPVTITVEPVQIDQITKVIRPVARIRWGTAGGQFLADIDVSAGIQFPISCSSVYVSGFLENGSAQDLNLSASIGFHSTGGNAVLFRSSYVTSLGASATVNVPRQVFCNLLYGFERSSSTAACLLDFRDNDGTILMQRNIASGSNLISPIGLPNDVVNVRLTNNSASAINARFVWQMALG